MAGFRTAGPVGLYQEPLPVLEDGGPGDDAAFAGGAAEDPALALGSPDGVTLAFGGERYRLRSTESPWGSSGEEQALTDAERAQFFVKAALQDLDPALK